jgi:acetyltransferase
MSSLRPILAPKSIAVIGASRRHGSMGQQVVHNLLSYGFTGAVYPVNPNARAICGVHAYASVTDLPAPADLGIIVVPRDHVLEAVTECGESGIKGLIVISAGFREMNAEGATREAEVLAAVRHYGMRMVGPNCLGVVNANPDVSMNATFATATPSPAGLPIWGRLLLSAATSVVGAATPFRVPTSTIRP